MRIPAASLLWILAASNVMGDSQAPAGATDSTQLKQRLAALQSRMAQVDQQVESLKKRRKGVMVELQGISLQRDRVRAQLDGARLKQDQAQLEAQQITSDQAKIRTEIDRLRKDLRKQIRLIQARGELGDLAFLPDASGFESYLTQTRHLSWWRLQERKRINQIQRLQGDLAQRENELKAVLARLASEQQEAAQFQGGLTLSEEKLQSFLGALQQDEQAQKQVQAELAEEAIQLERMLSGLIGKSKAETFEAPVSFTSLRGDLPGPVEGTLAQGFGEHLHPRFHTKTFQSGLLIEAYIGSRVAAVADGKVILAEPYQSYGPIVIVDHGNGWYTLYTHLQATAVSKGQTLRQGDTVGTVGETLDGPRLGFEIRYQTKPEDPNKWLKKKYR
ncbi:MAG: peptidoglycan DD-metalloendopeptidase family protein [Holophagaceae bacterium]|nr:peptidoglycan DD-metalloendopeptidase family protein [Holophagaceae bacterium]